jgi:hypothetical protein
MLVPNELAGTVQAHKGGFRIELWSFFRLFRDRSAVVPPVEARSIARGEVNLEIVTRMLAIANGDAGNPAAAPLLM